MVNKTFGKHFTIFNIFDGTAAHNETLSNIILCLELELYSFACCMVCFSCLFFFFFYFFVCLLVSLFVYLFGYHVFIASVTSIFFPCICTYLCCYGLAVWQFCYNFFFRNWYLLYFVLLCIHLLVYTCIIMFNI